MLTAQRRLRREAEMLTDARLDANGYELVCRHADADLRAAMAEGDAIQMTTRGGLHPPARTTRANVEAWLEALLHRDLRAKRAALESLLYSLEVERVGFARFTATVQWTPIGAALQAVVRRCGGVAQ